MTPRIRFSISPTEIPHVTNLHQALMSWAVTRTLDGDLILRVEDAYFAPSENAEIPMLTALEWLNIDWDEGVGYGGDYEPYAQSKRLNRYETVFNQLRQQNYIHQVGENWLLTDGVGVVAENGRFSIQFRAIIDDHDMAISYIVCQSDADSQSFSDKIHELLDWQAPEQVLIPPLLTANQTPLLARGYRLEDLQNQGYLSKAIFNFLALLGWEAPPSEMLDKWQVRKQFRLKTLSAKSVWFDWNRFRVINAQYIQKMGVAQLAEEIRPFLEDAYGALPMADGWLEKLTAMIKPDLQTLEEAIEVAEWALSDDFEMSDAAEAKLELPKARPILAQTVAELATVVLLDEKTAQTIISGIQNRVTPNEPDQVTHILQAVLTGGIDNISLPQLMGILGKQTALQRIANQLQ